MTNEEFKPFPIERTQQIEARQRAKQPYQSPHLPKNRVAAADMQLSVLPSVPVQNPGFTAPMSEPEAVALELPSRYAFNDFKDLYIKTFKGLHLAKLSRAKEEGSTLHMVETVSSVLSNSNGDTNLGFKLTVPDFYFVLYWLRLNSYTKSVFTHESICVNEEHIQKVSEGLLPAESLCQGELIHKSTLQTTMLDNVPNLENFKLSSGVELRQPTMQDAIEMLEDPDFANADFRFSAQVASYIKVPLSLKERIAIVNEMSPDDITTIKDYEKATPMYGIVEKVRVTCRGCGAVKMDEIRLDAS